jgi:hypothetical protein
MRRGQKEDRKRTERGQKEDRKRTATSTGHLSVV